MDFLVSHGYRVIAHDQRGHGRSTQNWTEHNMEIFVDDLEELYKHLDIKNAMIVGNSHGGGEVTRFLGKHGTSRVKKAVLVGAVPPLMLKSSANPGEPKTRTVPQLFLDVQTGPFFGFNRPNAAKSKGQIRSWWEQGMRTSFRAAYDSIKDFSETDFTKDLKSIDIPVLVLHGDDDQIVPIGAAGLKLAKLPPQGKLQIYPGGSHAIHNVSVDEVNKDLLDFIKS
ncbi:non-heme chloroperoxidase [Penicillium waksmanii]|uniref:non-heme chloroperoxidase n=1 Tax=Penicillium waksmanii TaxID=69791 RepID=UPI0025497F16|nr:non-heme chloroperoxidase [Penicillium waksmanii]KAJ5995798.1 non-heme chloroperoxidase [Penicillium waksmanii]